MLQEQVHAGHINYRTIFLFKCTVDKVIRYDSSVSRLCRVKHGEQSLVEICLHLGHLGRFCLLLETEQGRPAEELEEKAAVRMLFWVHNRKFSI